MCRMGQAQRRDDGYKNVEDVFASFITQIYHPIRWQIVSTLNKVAAQSRIDGLSHFPVVLPSCAGGPRLRRSRRRTVLVLGLIGRTEADELF